MCKTEICELCEGKNETLGDGEKLKYCDQKNNIKFDPGTEACCGGNVKTKHPWVYSGS